MNKLLVFIGMLAIVAFGPCSALSKTVTVAVIDTGIDKASNDHLCKMGHKSFSTDSPNALIDNHGHGTHIAGIIAKEAGVGNYCLVSITYYSETASGRKNLKNLVAAINYAVNIKVDYINLSGGGPYPSEEEYIAINRALNAGIKVIVAAGNEHSNLDKQCNFYPACYSAKIVSVGNLQANSAWVHIASDPEWSQLAKLAGMQNRLGKIETSRSPSSNYGDRVSRWEVGTDIYSNLPGGKHGYMSGTSQATAVATGKLLKERFTK